MASALPSEQLSCTTTDTSEGPNPSGRQDLSYLLGTPQLVSTPEL